MVQDVPLCLHHTCTLKQLLSLSLQLLMLLVFTNLQGSLQPSSTNQLTQPLSALLTSPPIAVCIRLQRQLT